MTRWEMFSNRRPEVGDNFRIDVYKLRRPSPNSAISNEVTQQPGQYGRHVLASEDLQTARYGNCIANDQIVKGLPARHGQKRMMSRYLNTPSGLSRHGKTWLDSAINPIANIAQLNTASWRKAENQRTPALYELFNGQSGTRLRVVDEGTCDGTFPDSRPCSNDD